MLRPDSQWRWYFDQQQACLAMQVSEQMVFMTPYGVKQLGHWPQQSEDFDLQDHEHYSLALSWLEAEPEFSDPFKTQAALNACAALRYHKPLMPKSWFFRRGHSGSGLGLATLASEVQSARVLVLQEGESCLCMLLDESLPLAQAKPLQQFALIKVMRDCLQRPQPPVPLRRLA